MVLAHTLKQTYQNRQGWAIYLGTTTITPQAPDRAKEMQRLSIDPIIERSKMPVLAEYVDAQIGPARNRQTYQQMIDDAAHGRFSHLIVASPDRLGRNTAEVLYVLNHLEDLGVKVQIATIPDVEDFASSQGRLLVSVMFALADYEAAQHRERIKTALRNKLEKGIWPWPAPDGYQKRPQNDTTPSMIPDPQQAEVWRYAWTLLLNGLTLAEICESLDAHGYTLRSGKHFVETSPDGRKTHNRTVLSRAFNNPVYAGMMNLVTENEGYRTYKGNWEPIISLQDFARGQALLSRSNSRKQVVRKMQNSNDQPTE